MYVQVAKREHLEALLWGAGLAIVCSLPYLMGYLKAPLDKYYLGFVLNAGDSNTYFMWMTQAASGDLFLKNLYTAIEHEGAMLNLVFLIGGWIAQLTGSLDIAYQVLRIAAIVTLAWSAWLFVATFIDDCAKRRWAYLILVFGAGLGWGLNIYRLFTGDFGGAIVDTDLMNRPLDLWVPEGYLFYSMLVMPHFTFAIAFLLLTVRYAALGVSQQRLGYTLTAGGFCFVLSFVHPYDVLIALGLSGMVATMYTLRQRRIDLSLWRHVLILFLLSVGPILYNYWILNSNPGMQAWLKQNRSGSPLPWSYIAGYGFLFVGAIVYAWKRKADIGASLAPVQWLFAWLILLPIALYAPIEFQRRLVIGASAPLAVLSTLLVFAWVSRPTMRNRLILLMVVALVSLTSAFHWLNSFRKVSDYSSEYFTDQSTVYALAYISGRPNDDDLSVLSSFETGNLIPRFTGYTTVIGSRGQTGNFDYLLSETRKFFSGEMSVQDMHHLVDAQRVGWILITPKEIAAEPLRFAQRLSLIGFEISFQSDDHAYIVLERKSNTVPGSIGE